MTVINKIIYLAIIRQTTREIGNIDKDSIVRVTDNSEHIHINGLKDFMQKFFYSLKINILISYCVNNSLIILFKNHFR